jgi:PAS domain S-box-containing protein
VVFPFVMGLVVLGGWYFGWQRLTTNAAGFSAMQPNAAVGLLLAALSLALLLKETTPRIVAGKVLAVLVLGLGLLTTVEYLFGTDLRIDTLLAGVPASESSTQFPMRMSPFTAFCLLSFGIGLLFLTGRTRFKMVISELAVLAAIATALLALMGHAYGATSFYRIGNFHSIAVHTALALLLLGIGILAARPERGLGSLLTRDTSGSLLARRLLPTALIVPLVLGWLRVKAERAGYVELPIGTALLVVALVVIFAALIWRTALSLDQADRARQQTENALRESDSRYRTLFESIDEGFCVIEVLFDEQRTPVDYRFLEINPSFEQHTGLVRALGKRVRELIPNHDPHWLEIYGRVALTGEPTRFENYSAPIQRWFDVRAARVGRPEESKVAVLFTSITHRKQAEAAMQRMAAIVESSQDAIISLDLNGDITTWNTAAERLFGYSAKEAVGQPAMLLIPADRVHEEAGLPDGSETFSNFETVRRHKNGTLVEVSLTISPVKDVEGRVSGVSKIMRDISERKRSERELAERANLLDLTNDAVVVRDNADRITFWNRGAVKLFGWEREEALGKELHSLLRTEFPLPLEEIKEELRRHGSFADSVVQLARDGHRIPSLCRWVLDRETDSILTSYTDMSAVQRAEAALRASEKKYRTLFEAMDEGFCIVEVLFDEAGRPNDWLYLDLNAAFERHNGITGALGKRMRELVPEIEPKWFEIYGRVARTGEPIRFVEYSEALQRWFDLYVYRVDGGENRNVAVLFTDITARKQAENALRESEERMRLATEATGVGIWEWNLPRDSLHWDPQMFRIYGLDPTPAGTVHLKVWSDAVLPEDLEQQRSILDDTIRQRGRSSREFRIRRGDTNEERRIESVETVRLNRAGQVEWVVGTNLDITERRKAEEELKSAREDLERHAERLEATVAERTAKLRESIGELEAFSYSLSHDMRAPLRAIQGFSQIALEDCGEESAQFVRKAITAAARLDRMIQQLLSFTKVARQEIRIEPLDVECLVRDIIGERQELQAPHAEVIVQSPLRSMLGHEASLTQCLTNLLSNSVKFVPRGAKPRVVVYSEPKGTVVRLWIEDNGIGIAPAAQAGLFEMFYRINSGSDYEGTGIGLAIVRKAVERMGGKVGIESEPGQGSRFWIELPEAG